MIRVFKINLFLVFFALVSQSFAQSDLHLIPIGDLKTVGGGTIKQCRIGYHMLGRLNADKTNVILWLTWYTGKSSEVAKVIPSIVDTSRFAVIVVDALGNGVSSSPSNSPNFPAITIRDMVNSQHELMIRHFGVNRVYAIGGISMGAMQTLEWLVAYPDFMDRAISIVGTPRQSFHDMLLWNTELELIKQAERIGNPEEMEQTRQRVADIQLMELYTPDYFLRMYGAGDLDAVLTKLYKDENYTLSNLRSQLEAMMDQDIYKSSGTVPEKIGEQIKAKLLIIVAVNDHMVNPQSAMSLTKQLSCKLELVNNDCGHNLLDCGSAQVEKTIQSFLK